MKGMSLCLTTFRKLSIHLHRALRGPGKASCPYSRCVLDIPLDKEFLFVRFRHSARAGSKPFSLNPRVHGSPMSMSYMWCGRDKDPWAVNLFILLKILPFSNVHEGRQCSQEGRVSARAPRIPRKVKSVLGSGIRGPHSPPAHHLLKHTLTDPLGTDPEGPSLGVWSPLKCSSASSNYTLFSRPANESAN